MNISNDVKYVGVNDHKIDLFEGQYVVPSGMSYNSYVILDREIAIIDTVDANFGEEWLSNVKFVLGERKPNYLIVEHMEPDHSANIEKLTNEYPEIKIVSTLQANMMMKNFFGKEFENKIIIKDGDTLSLGKHELEFVTAPLVHWPEVTFVYEKADKILFSADAFGKFGALDIDEEWEDEARRYYFGIVGKFGLQVQAVLNKLRNLEIKTICPLHGPVLNENLDYYVDKYKIWSSYEAESHGVFIAYTSVYGNTEKAVKLLVEKLKAKGVNFEVSDLARCDMSRAIENAFKFSKIVLATTTYNNEIFPFMHQFINELTHRNFQNRKVGLIENGTWAPMAIKTMKSMLENSKNLTYLTPEIKIMSALTEQNEIDIEALSNELAKV